MGLIASNKEQVDMAAVDISGVILADFIPMYRTGKIVV
jgi:hypothetical protein